jgi:hypothetical protein
MKRHIRSIDTGFEEDEYLFVYEFDENDLNVVEYDVFVNDKKYKICSPVKLESLLEYKSFVKQVALRVPEQPKRINIQIDQCFFHLARVDKNYFFDDFEGQAAVRYVSRFSKNIVEHWNNGKYS